MRDAAITLLIRLSGAALAFGLQALLARLMAVAEYGHFVVVWTWILSLGSFASLGLAEVALRVLPRYASRMRLRAVRGFFNHGFRTTALSACLFSIVGAAIASVLPIDPQSRLIVYGVCLGLPLLALEFFLEGVARAMGWFRLTTVTVYILRPVLMALCVAALWASGVALTGSTICIVLALCMAATTLFLRGVIQGRLSEAAHSSPSATMRKFWMKQSVPMLIASGLDDALTYIDVVLLGLLLSPVQSAVYFVASRVLTLAGIVQYAFYFVAARKFSLTLSGAEKNQALPQMWKATAMTFLTTLLAVLATYAGAPWLLDVFGSAYGSGFALVLVLGLAQLARALAGQGFELLLVSGRTRELTIINALALVILIAAFIVLVPVYGAIGAAWVLTIVMLLRAAAILAVCQL